MPFANATLVASPAPPSTTAAGRAATEAATEVWRVRQRLALAVEQGRPLPPLEAEHRGAVDDLLGRCRWLVLKLARGLAARRPSPRYDLDDLIAQGNLGVIRASETFNPNRGKQFSTYASAWIVQSMRSFVAVNCHALHVGRLAWDCAGGLDTGRKMRRGERERAEIAARVIGTAVERIHREGRNGRNGSRVAAADPPDPRDAIAEFDRADERGARLAAVLEGMPPRMLEVLTRRYLAPEPETAEDIAASWDVSHQRVTQIERLALDRARAMARRLERRGVGGGA